MIVLLYFLFPSFSAYTASAAPVLFNVVTRDAPLLNPESCTNQSRRTLFGIIWGCISTIILCAWTSVHPNVPPRSKWEARWNRLRMMFWMIIAPELVLAWAVRQFFAARAIRDMYNASHPELPDWKKWTLKHGHFLQMGGFTLINPAHKDARPEEQNGTVLTFDYFRANPNIIIPEITVEDIEDRSKGDVLFRLIAILQTTWFIIQCIARAQQRLGLAGLELVTLALASLNAVTFAIWWHKPMGVQEPVKIYLAAETPKVDSDQEVLHGQEHQNSGVSFRDVTYKAWQVVGEAPGHINKILCSKICCCTCSILVIIPAYLSYLVIVPIFVLFPWGIVLLLKMIKTEPVPQQKPQSRGVLGARIIASLQKFRYSLSLIATESLEALLTMILDSDQFFFHFGWLILLPLLFVLLALFTIFLASFVILLALVTLIFTTAFGIVTTSTTRLGASHVPPFYAPVTQSDRWTRMVAFALLGFIFGGLHCIAWNFKFPTHFEQTLWRATSLVITGIPLIVALIDILLAYWDINSSHRFRRNVLLSLDLIMTILLFIYVPARLSLIGQALALLRNQQSSVLIAVDWTKYIPHQFS